MVNRLVNMMIKLASKLDGHQASPNMYIDRQIVKITKLKSLQALGASNACGSLRKEGPKMFIIA